MKLPLRIVVSLWGQGSGGFGFGVWRCYQGNNHPPIWTIAIGPLSIYIRRLEAGE